MHKRLPYFCAGHAVSGLRYIVAPGPPLGAVIVSWDMDSAKNTVTLHMANKSGKDITAYNIKSVKLTGRM